MLATGETVVTSWTHSIYRGVEVAGEAAVIEQAPVVPSGGDGEAGLRATAITIAIPREMPHVYTECASIWNPIHTERAVALAAGLPDIILHGTATWALAGREVLRALRRRRSARGCGGCTAASARWFFPAPTFTSSTLRAVAARSTSWCATTAVSLRSIRVTPSSTRCERRH